MLNLLVVYRTCNYCKSDECAHVGFTICLEQLEGHRPSGEEETVDDIVDS